MPLEQPKNIDQPKKSKESAHKTPEESTEKENILVLKQKAAMIFKWLTNSENKEDRKSREDALRTATEKLKKLIPELKIQDPPKLIEWIQKELKELDEKADTMDPMSDYICEQYPGKFLKFIAEHPESGRNEKYLKFLEKAARSAADINPELALSYSDLYKSQPYAKEVLEKASDKEPGYALGCIYLYKSQPYAKKILEKVVRNVADKNPASVFDHFDLYKSQPYAKEILEKAVRSDPELALTNNYFDLYKSQPYAKEVLEKVADKNPGLVFDIFDLYKSQPYAKEVLEKIGLSFSTATLTEKSALRIVRIINSLHELKDDFRFAITSKIPASTIYNIIVEGDREILTSSFNGLFNRFLAKMHAEGKKGDQVMQSGDGTKTFLRLCASYNRLSEFLATMDPTKAQQILRGSVIDLGKPEDRLKNAVTLADTFSVLKDPALMSSMSGFVKEAYVKAEKAGDQKTMKLYGLLASVAASKIADPWFSQMAVKYPLENVSTLASKELFNPDGKNIQQYFFYNDNDGKDSFANFLRYYRAQSDWKIEDRGSYVQISKKEKDKTVEMYANKPENEDDGPEDIQKIFATKNIKTIVVVHRGHSFHAAKTIARITDIARIVWMGSCGGYNEVTAVLGKSPKAHIISTKGTGTMLVNDPLLKALNETILSGKDITWSTFWTEAEKKLGKNENFSNYVSPDKNLGVNFLKSYQRE